MKAYATTLFIFSVLTLLAIICWLWPADGISVCGVQLNWPAFTEVISTQPAGNVGYVGTEGVADTMAAKIEQLSPEELIAQEMETAYQAKEEQFVQFCEVSPTRLFLPNDSAAYLDSFFEALDNASSQQVRIIHYGDSQIEEDRISSQLRNNLQNRFGGIGLGLQPAMKRTDKATLQQRTNPSLSYNMLYAQNSYRAKDKRYGPLLQVCRVNGTATVTIEPSKYTNFPHSRQFDHIGTLADGEGSIEIVTADSSYVLVADTLTEMKQLYLDLPEPVDGLQYIFQGRWNVYGLMLDGQTGITVDNIPMRGYSGNTFHLNDMSTMAPFYDAQNVSLMILQFGGNAVPGLSGERSIESYKNSIGITIDYFHKLVPNACILLIGPADMSTNVKGEMQTYPQLPKLVTALKEAAVTHNAAFWSMYDAMGGWNSMIKWVEARPQLAGDDYIHFTRKGADKMADLLNEVVMSYYKNYRLRNRLDALENETDSTLVECLSTDMAECDSTGAGQH